MNNKCPKYEGLFIFSTEEELKKHIEECPDCKAEHEKMERVSDAQSGKLAKNLVLKKALVDLKGKTYPAVEKVSE